MVDAIQESAKNTGTLHLGNESKKTQPNKKSKNNSRNYTKACTPSLLVKITHAAKTWNAMQIVSSVTRLSSSLSQ